MASRAEAPQALMEVEDTQLVENGCPTTPEATPPREPSRPLKPMRSLSRHELDPDLKIRPFPALAPASPDKAQESPADDASVRYDSEDGKL